MDLHLPKPPAKRRPTARERRAERHIAHERQKLQRDRQKLDIKTSNLTAWKLSPWVAMLVMAALLPSDRDASDPYAAERGAARREPGRGRDAAKPSDIPVLGWRDVIVRTFKEFNDDQITSVAGGVTFFGLLALFPAMAAFVALYGLFADVQDVPSELAVMAGVLPHDILGFVGDQMVRIAALRRGGGLSFAFVIALVLSIWSANAGMKALFRGLNIACDEKEKRKFIKLNLISLTFTIGGVIFLLAAAAVVAIVPLYFSFKGLNVGLVSLLRWPVLLVGMIMALAVVYRYGPSREHPRWRWVTPGSVVASVLWLGGSLLFSWYLSNFAHYDRTYGSMGAGVGLMTWLWLSSIIVLLGAELNSEIEHQTGVDSTTGQALPLGVRGAAMADSIGEAQSGLKTPSRSRRRG